MKPFLTNCFRYYCPGGRISSSKPEKYSCPPGHFCPNGSEVPTICPNATYQNATHGKECIACPPGFYCDPVAEGPVSIPKSCPAGYYCLIGTSYKKTYPCPQGTYGDLEGYANKSQCKICSNGSYCQTTGLSKPTAPCNAGFYCQLGSIYPTPIKYLNASGWIFPYYNDKCPRGYYCPDGTSYPEPCRKGFFSGAEGLRASTDCTPCPPGRYCSGIGSKDAVQAPNCSAGYVCLHAAKTPEPEDSITGYICPKGFYCPEGKCCVLCVYIYMYVYCV